MYPTKLTALSPSLCCPSAYLGWFTKPLVPLGERETFALLLISFLFKADEFGLEEERG